MLVPRNLAKGIVVIDTDDLISTTTTATTINATHPPPCSPSKKRRKRRQRARRDGAELNASLLLVPSAQLHISNNTPATRRPHTSVLEFDSHRTAGRKIQKQSSHIRPITNADGMRRRGHHEYQDAYHDEQGDSHQGRNAAIDARIQTLSLQSERIGANLTREVELLSLSMNQTGEGGQNIKSGLLGSLRASANRTQIDSPKRGKLGQNGAIKTQMRLMMTAFARWKEKVMLRKKRRRGIDTLFRYKRAWIQRHAVRRWRIISSRLACNQHTSACIKIQRLFRLKRKRQDGKGMLVQINQQLQAQRMQSSACVLFVMETNFRSIFMMEERIKAEKSAIVIQKNVRGMQHRQIFEAVKNPPEVVAKRKEDQKQAASAMQRAWRVKIAKAKRAEASKHARILQDIERKRVLDIVWVQWLKFLIQQRVRWQAIQKFCVKLDVCVRRGLSRNRFESWYAYMESERSRIRKIIKLQTIFRAKLGRKILQLNQARQAASTRIQALFRGKRGRDYFSQQKRGKRAANTILYWYRWIVWRRIFLEIRLAKDRLARGVRTFETTVRAILWKKRFKDDYHKAGCMRIQQWWRVLSNRMSIARLKMKEDILKECGAEWQIWPLRYSKSGVAPRYFQSRLGLKASKHLPALKVFVDESEVVETVEEVAEGVEEPESTEDLEALAAAAAFQLALEQAICENDAASLIRRCLQARRLRKEMSGRAELSKIRIANEHRSALRIQSVTRGWRTRQKRQKIMLRGREKELMKEYIEERKRYNWNKEWHEHINNEELFWRLERKKQEWKETLKSRRGLELILAKQELFEYMKTELYGWVRVVDPYIGEYFLHEASGYTQWEEPPHWLEARQDTPPHPQLSNFVASKWERYVVPVEKPQNMTDTSEAKETNPIEKADEQKQEPEQAEYQMIYANSVTTRVRKGDEPVPVAMRERPCHLPRADTALLSSYICTVCTNKTADRLCLSCGSMPFCQPCFISCHGGLGTRDHNVQVLCEPVGNAEELDLGEPDYDPEAEAAEERRLGIKSKKKKEIVVLCSECDRRRAKWYCDNCWDSFCATCDALIHTDTSRPSHKRIPESEHVVLWEIIDNRAHEGGGKIMFYNIETKELTDIKPIDLMHGDEREAAFEEVANLKKKKTDLEETRGLLLEEGRLLAEHRDYLKRRTDEEKLIDWFNDRGKHKGRNFAKFIAPSLVK